MDNLIKNYWYNSKEGKLYREDKSKRTCVDFSDEIDKLCEQLQKLKAEKSDVIFTYEDEEIGRVSSASSNRYTRKKGRQ